MVTATETRMYTITVVSIDGCQVKGSILIEVDKKTTSLHSNRIQS